MWFGPGVESPRSSCKGRTFNLQAAQVGLARALSFWRARKTYCLPRHGFPVCATCPMLGSATATVAILELPHFRTRGGAFSFCTGPCQLYNWSYFTFGCLHLPFSIIIIFFFWPRPWHAEVPEPGTKPDLNHGSSDDARSLTPGLPGNSLFSYLLNFKGSHFSKLKNSIPHRIKTNTDIYYLFCTFRRALMSTVVHKLQYTPHMANP